MPTKTTARKPYVRRRAAKPSKIEAHPERARIEYDLRKGVPVRVIAKKYALTPISLYRHVTKQPEGWRAETYAELLKPGSSENLERMKTEEAEGLLAGLVSQRAKIMTLQDVAIELVDADMFARLSAQFHRNIEITAKHLGELGAPSTTINNNVTIIAPFFMDVKALLLQQIERHPEDKEMIIAKLRDLDRRHLLPAPAAPAEAPNA